MTTPAEEIELQIARRLYHNRIIAHQTLFKHRHPDETPAFHRQMNASWHSDFQNVLWLVFRGGAKSTIAEEGITINAGFREFRNGLIIGETLDRASERLTAIKAEIEQNDLLEVAFGDLKGNVWGSEEIVLKNGIRILAMGKGQSIRGIKFEDRRPDFVFVDDLESEETAETPAARTKVKRWFLKELLPALDPNYRLRMAATPLDREALAVELSKDESFHPLKFPIEYKGEHGERVPMWASRFPLEKIDQIKQTYQRLGVIHYFNMEYMLEVDDPKDKAFRSEMIKVEPTVRTWQNVYVMFDPARTINRSSATTGMAAWSWVGPKLIVWESWGRKLLPNEIVNEIFAADEAFKPALIGVEADGLEEWLMQPIRQEAAKRGITLPLVPVHAPDGKMDFIRGLQPFYAAREVIHAKDLPDLKAQLLSFPSGEIDAPNALAYALPLRAGLPIYDAFGPRHISQDLAVVRDVPAYLCVNAAGGMLSAVLMQMMDGTLRVYRDWLREGEPGIMLQRIYGDACAEAGQRVRVIAPPLQFTQHNNAGVVQAARGVQAEVRKGVDPEKARPSMQSLLERERRGMAMVTIASNARFTLNGFAGAFARKVDPTNMLARNPIDGIYRTVMEGLESGVGIFTLSLMRDDEANLRYDTTKTGQSYLSARR